MNSLNLSIQEGRYMRDQIERLNDQIISLKDQITNLESDLMSERKRLIEVVSENGLLRHNSESIPDATQIKNLVSHSLSKLSKADLIAINLLLERLDYYERQQRRKDKQWQTMFESYEERLKEQIERNQRERVEHRNALSELDLRIEKWENIAAEAVEENIRLSQLGKAHSGLPAHVPSLQRVNTAPSLDSIRESEYKPRSFQTSTRKRSNYLGRHPVLQQSYRPPFVRESQAHYLDWQASQHCQPDSPLADMTAVQRTQALKVKLQEILDSIYHITHSKTSIDAITHLAHDIKDLERQSLKYLPLKGRIVEEHFEQIEQCKRVLEEMYKEARTGRWK